MSEISAPDRIGNDGLNFDVFIAEISDRALSIDQDRDLAVCDARYTHTLADTQARANDLAYDIQRALVVDKDRVRTIILDLNDPGVSVGSVELELLEDEILVGQAEVVTPSLDDSSLNSDSRHITLQMEGALPKPSPPAQAQRLLYWLASSTWDEAVVGDFFEEYQRDFEGGLTTHGPLFARLNYWRQVLRSAPGFLEIRLRHHPFTAGVKAIVQRCRWWQSLFNWRRREI